MLRESKRDGVCTCWMIKCVLTNMRQHTKSSVWNKVLENKVHVWHKVLVRENDIAS